VRHGGDLRRGAQQQLAPMLDKISALPDELGQAETLLADSGYFSEANVEACAAADIEPLIPQGRQTHYPPLSKRFAKAPPAPENTPSFVLQRRTGRATRADGLLESFQLRHARQERPAPSTAQPQNCRTSGHLRLEAQNRLIKAITWLKKLTLKPGLVFGRRALELKQERPFDLLDIDAAVLHRLDGVGQLHQLARGGVGIGEVAIRDELNPAALSGSSAARKKRITVAAIAL
jgi:hypothetical protein